QLRRAVAPTLHHGASDEVSLRSTTNVRGRVAHTTHAQVRALRSSVPTRYPAGPETKAPTPHDCATPLPDFASTETHRRDVAADHKAAVLSQNALRTQQSAPT